MAPALARTAEGSASQCRFTTWSTSIACSGCLAPCGDRLEPDEGASQGFSGSWLRAGAAPSLLVARALLRGQPRGCAVAHALACSSIGALRGNSSLFRRASGTCARHERAAEGLSSRLWETSSTTRSASATRSLEALVAGLLRALPPDPTVTIPGGNISCPKRMCVTGGGAPCDADEQRLQLMKLLIIVRSCDRLHREDALHSAASWLPPPCSWRAPAVAHSTAHGAASPPLPRSWRLALTGRWVGSEPHTWDDPCRLLDGPLDAHGLERSVGEESFEAFSGLLFRELSDPCGASIVRLLLNRLRTSRCRVSVQRGVYLCTDRNGINICLNSDVRAPRGTYYFPDLLWSISGHFEAHFFRAHLRSAP